MILELLTQSFRYFLINKLQIMSINNSCDKTSVSFIVKPVKAVIMTISIIEFK